MRQQLVKTMLLTACAGGAVFAADSADPFANFDASKVRDTESKLRWGAYGELHYNDYQGGDKNSKLDLHRLVFLAEYNFEDDIKFVTEIEIEHAFVNDGQGELEVEQAYIDFSINENFGVRAGVMLVPISIMNLYHEPTLFFGVERPFTQSQIVPTTWFEPGIGIYGQANDQLSYEVTLQAGLDQSGFDEDGLRGGRQKAYNSAAEDMMLTARVDFRPTPEIWLAAGLNTGATAQDATGNNESGNVTVLTLEGRYDGGPIKAGLTYSNVSIGDAEDIAPGVSESLSGLEIFGGYDLMTFIDPDSDKELSFFVRFETFDSQEDVPNIAEDESEIGTVLTYGFDFKPHENVAVKIDYQDFESDDDSRIDQWNMGIGWMF